MAILQSGYSSTTTPSPFPFPFHNNVTAQVANNTHNDSDSGNETTECWNEYCWDESEYTSALEEHIFPKSYEWFFIVLYALTFVVGLVGNFLVCFAVWRNHNMRTVTNVFIVNLALGDFLVILLCLPPTLVQNVSLTWFLGAAMCKTLLFLQNTSVSVSVLTLSAIAVERWYAICYPLRFKSTLTRARNIIVIIWITAMLIALPELIVADTHAYEFPPPFKSVLLTDCRPSWESWKQSIYQIILAIALYLAPIVLMTLTYTHIALVLWMQEIPGDSIQGHRPMMNGARNNGGTRGGSRLPEDQLASRRKAAKMLIAIVIVFAICYLPVHLMNVLRYFGVLTFAGDGATVQPLISHWLPYFNSALNPVIYNFMSAKFRKEFKVACFCCFYCGFRNRPFRRRDHNTFTMTFSHSNYSNCHTEEVTLASLKD
ncbi:orexin receptor type 2-like [Littorina saxatilis]|uniref:G-protein coupled receptors family 1 profile domain-containing protein n=1 Tax=Littorina saxatilis TaxID=31220 RepID=A0AAN9FYF7_9CAEN